MFIIRCSKPRRRVSLLTLLISLLLLILMLTTKSQQQTTQDTTTTTDDPYYYYNSQDVTTVDPEIYEEYVEYDDTRDREKDLLDYWDVEDSSTQFEFYEECNTFYRCIGLPDGCIGSHNCQALVTIQPPRGPFDVWFEFRMFLKLPKDQLKTDVNKYVAVGLNKHAQTMAGASVMICYFTVINGVDTAKFWSGWTEGRTLVPVQASPGSYSYFVTTVNPVNTVMKCRFKRRQITSISFNESSQPTLAKKWNHLEKSLLKFKLRHESYYLIMAVGDVVVDPKTLVPDFKQHSSKDRTSINSAKLPFTTCGDLYICIGVGSDGCHHTAEEPCDNLFLTLVTHEAPNDRPGTMMFQLASTVAVGSFSWIGIGLSNTTNAAQALQNLFLLYICERNNTESFIYQVKDCTRIRENQPEVICESWKKIDPFDPNPHSPLHLQPGGLELSPLGLIENPNKPFTVTCAAGYNFMAYTQLLDSSGAIGRDPLLYTYLLSGNDSTYRNKLNPLTGSGPITLQISILPSSNSVRTKFPISFFKNDTYSDFFVLPKPKPTRRTKTTKQPSSDTGLKLQVTGGYFGIILSLMSLVVF